VPSSAGQASTISLASLRPSSGLNSRTTLMTAILLVPALAMTTSNSVFSSAVGALAAPAPVGAGAATAAATALTSNFSSKALTRSDNSKTVSSEMSVRILSNFLSIIWLIYKINFQFSNSNFQ